MRFKKIICLAAVFSLILPCSFASAESAVSAKQGENTVTITVPSKFKSLTADDIDKDSDYFQDLPLSKNEAVKKIQGGVLIDAFSNDKQREIKVSTSSDSASEKIVNFTPLPEAEKQSFIETLKSGLQDKGHIFLSQPQIIEQSGYSFVKYFARIGGSDNGYSYTCAMTIVGGTYYEITCYNSTVIPDQSMIDANDEVIKSVKLDIKGDSGEIASNIVQTVLSYAIVIAAAVVIVLIIRSFVKQFVNRTKADDQIKLHKRN